MKDKLKKIGTNEWLVSKELREGMKVDAKIFANDDIFEGLEDAAVEQLTNVACLPGVLEPVVALPDMHWGYGLPMGAVGAFDLEKGVISAGCTGFDINCISGDTKVLHEFGYSKPIKDFTYSWAKDSIKCMNPTTKVKNTKIELFFKQRPKSKVFEVSTLSGRKIVCSEDHPLFTEKGMVPLKNIKDEKISIYPFEGVKYEEPLDDIIIPESNFDDKDIQIVNGLKRRQLLPIKYSTRKLPYLIRLLGFLWGDGCAYISKGRAYVCAYSKDKDEMEKVAEDIRHVGYSPYISSRDRHHEIDTFYGKVVFDTRSHEMRCSSNALFHLLRELGLPTGDKTMADFKVPGWLMKAPLWQKRLFLAGLFGAELSSPKTVTGHGFNFNSPVFSLNKLESLIPSGEIFLKQIQDILQDFGIESNIINHRRDYVGKKGVKYRLRLQISSKPENLIRLWSMIGYEYAKNKSYLANAAVQYLRMKTQVVKERKNAIIKANILRKKGERPINIYKQLQSRNVNKRFLQRTIFEGRKDVPRVAFNFHKFDEFVNIYTNGLGQTGQIWDKIVDKKELDFNDYVYDFTVRDEHHNFVANNFVVSNCGINMINTNLTAEEVQEKLKELVPALFDAIPCGVGSKGKLRLTMEELNEVLRKGVDWVIEKGYGVENDKKHTEEKGRMDGADPSKVTDLAKKRGGPQLGTLGAGNHFLEIQRVEEVFDEGLAKKWGLKKGNVVIMLHCGSRGLGHQVATDYLKIHEKAAQKYGIKLPDRQLVCAPFNSPEGQDYFAAMKCAVNYAFANRQVMTHWVRETFEKVFGKSWKDMEMHMIYAIAHNIAKVEEHTVNGKKKEVLVHRKGATRSFPNTPVLIAGSMGTASYILVGTEMAMEKTFGSSCHGAGRCMSRNKAISTFRGGEIQRELEAKGEIVKSTSPKVLAEEAPGAYKDVDEVIESVHEAGISLKVAKMKPMGVVKG